MTRSDTQLMYCSIHIPCHFLRTLLDPLQCIVKTPPNLTKPNRSSQKNVHPTFHRLLLRSLVYIRTAPYNHHTNQAILLLKLPNLPRSIESVHLRQCDVDEDVRERPLGGGNIEGHFVDEDRFCWWCGTRLRWGRVGLMAAGGFEEREGFNSGGADMVRISEAPL